MYRLFDLIFKRVNGKQRVPIRLLLEAFLVMFSEICEELRVKNTRLGEIMERAAWERHFANVRVDNDSAATSTRARSRSPRRGHDDASGASNQVYEMNKLKLTIENHANELRNLKRKSEESAKGDKGKNGKGGKGSKNGKGQRSVYRN